jgi:two-component system osmolarity sensor histidine kinase EnvZ
MDDTSPTSLETAPAQLDLRPRRGLNLFWRTFFFLALLLFGSIVAWLQTFRALESEPRAIQSAQQLASLVNLSRAALRYSDAIGRVSLIKTLAEEEQVRITPREPTDQVDTFERDKLSERIA